MKLYSTEFTVDVTKGTTDEATLESAVTIIQEALLKVAGDLETKLARILAKDPKHPASVSVDGNF